MADLTLSLGGVDFADFEIPEEIAGGGAQILQTKKFAGGKRSVNAFGPDDAPLAWSGTFMDGTAEARCQQIDAMRKAGAPVALTWSSFSYQVTISRFTWKFQRFYQIPYEIELEVVADNTQPATDDGHTTESDIQGDLDDSAGYSASIDEAGLNSLMGGISDAATSVSSITGASTSFLNSFSSQISAAQSYVSSLSDGFDGDLDAIPAIASGTDPVASAAQLVSAGADTQMMATTFALTNTLTRLGKNVASITG